MPQRPKPDIHKHYKESMGSTGWRSRYHDQPEGEGLFEGIHFHTHTNNYNKAEAIQLSRLLTEHGAHSHRTFTPSEVVFVFLEPPQFHLIVPYIDVGEMDGSKFTIEEVFQHHATRTNSARDMCYKRRKRVVQGEWVHECLSQGRRLEFGKWEIKVDNGPGLTGIQPQQTGQSVIRPNYSRPTYDMPFEGLIDSQLPNFKMTGPRIHPSRLQQMNTGNSESYHRNQFIQGPTIRADDASSIAHTRSISPTASVITTTTQAIQHGNHQESTGVFVKGQPLPLAFHVLAGPMQKVAEMTIIRMGGGVIVPLHRASIVVVPEIGIRIASSDHHRQLVEEMDPSRAVISFDWVTECVEREKLLDLNEYKLQCPSHLSFEKYQNPVSGTYANSIASSSTSEETIARTEEIVYPTTKQNNDENDSKTSTPKNVPPNLPAGPVTNAPPTPPMTPTIDSINNNLEKLAWAKLTPDKSGVTAEAVEVPEHMLSSYFWLEDKLHGWGKSGFGGSLVGFFTRVKMQDNSRTWYELFHTYKDLYFEAIPGLKEKMVKQA